MSKVYNESRYTIINIKRTKNSYFEGHKIEWLTRLAVVWGGPCDDSVTPEFEPLFWRLNLTGTGVWDLVSGLTISEFKRISISILGSGLGSWIG